MAIALVAGERRWVWNGAGGALASEHLLPQIDVLLTAAGIARQALAAIAFGQGPGAFTGLRTSCAVAQGLALGLDLPVLPMDSLMLVAQQAWREQAPPLADGVVQVVMDARMGELYAATYQRVGEDWQVRTAPRLCAPEVWEEEHAGQDTLWRVGSGLALLAATPQDRPVSPDRASALADLAQRAWVTGLARPAEQALPLYLRDKVAQTTAEREAARQAQSVTERHAGETAARSP